MTRILSTICAYCCTVMLILITAGNSTAFYWQPWPKGKPPGGSLPPPTNEPPGNPPTGPPGDGPPGSTPPVSEPPGSVVPEPSAILAALAGLGTVIAAGYWPRTRR